MDKQIWVKPAGKDVVTAAVENGISTLVFTDDKSIEEAGQLVRVSFGRIQDEFLYCPDGYEDFTFFSPQHDVFVHSQLFHDASLMCQTGWSGRSRRFR
mmetsp:Transcript_11303/g.47111  ORF Transcript_11303/g.47111 Transcript_11303/m.47111 type:complete len:98 (-) Transcript_11303:2247-2540(-)